MTHRTITIRYEAGRWHYPWVARYDDYDGPGSPLGFGETETEAVENLLDASEVGLATRIARIEKTLSLRVVELERALAFYGDAANHVGHRDPDASVHIETSAIDTDGGERARAVLKGT